MSQAGKRNLQLDVLRGIAILLVLGRHIELPRPGGAIGFVAEAWFRIGWVGVDLFFVLSGFLIGGLLLSELDRHGTIDVPRFLMRRGLKIYPPYFVFLAYLVAMPLIKAFVRGGEMGRTFSEQWNALWPNLLFLQNYVGTNPIGHTWSLAVEEHFYLVLPFALVALAWAGRARKLVPLCAAAVPVCLALRCVSVWGEDAFAVKMSATHLRLDALLFGVAVRGVAQFTPGQFLIARRWRGTLLATWALLWLPHFFLDPGSELNRTIGLAATFVGAAALLLATYHTHAADFGRWAWCVTPAASLLAWIGVYSYAIYLWHVTIMRMLERALAGRLLEAFGHPGLVWTIGGMVIIASAILAGAVASKVIEWPVLRLRDRFFPSRSGSLPVASAHAPVRVVVQPPVSVPSELAAAPAAFGAK